MNKVDLLLQMLCLEFWSKCYKVNPDVVFLMNGLCGEQDYNSWWSISCIDFGIVRWGHVLTAQPGTLPFCIHACKAFGSIPCYLNVDGGKKGSTFANSTLKDSFVLPYVNRGGSRIFRRGGCNLWKSHYFLNFRCVFLASGNEIPSIFPSCKKGLFLIRQPLQKIRRKFEN